MAAEGEARGTHLSPTTCPTCSPTHCTTLDPQCAYVKASDNPLAYGARGVGGVAFPGSVCVC